MLSKRVACSWRRRRHEHVELIPNNNESLYEIEGEKETGEKKQFPAIHF
jgi:hypothetical protein